MSRLPPVFHVRRPSATELAPVAPQPSGALPAQAAPQAQPLTAGALLPPAAQGCPRASLDADPFDAPPWLDAEESKAPPLNDDKQPLMSAHRLGERRVLVHGRWVTPLRVPPVPEYLGHPGLHEAQLVQVTEMLRLPDWIQLALVSRSHLLAFQSDPRLLPMLSAHRAVRQVRDQAELARALQDELRQLRSALPPEVFDHPRTPEEVEQDRREALRCCGLGCFGSVAAGATGPLGWALVAGKTTLAPVTSTVAGVTAFGVGGLCCVASGICCLFGYRSSAEDATLTHAETLALDTQRASRALETKERFLGQALQSLPADDKSRLAAEVAADNRDSPPQRQIALAHGGAGEPAAPDAPPPGP